MAFRSPRRGFSLLELLAVLAVVGILASLLAVAVQGAREAARRTACVNHLRQIGIGLSSYHAAHATFPPGCIWAGAGLLEGALPGTVDVSFYGANWRADPARASWAALILPDIEADATYALGNWSLAGSSPANETLRGTVLSAFVCPSDDGARLACAMQGGGWARGNYAISAGADFPCVNSTRFGPMGCRPRGLADVGVSVFPDDPERVAVVLGGGMAGVNRGIRAAEVIDGLAKTVIVSELRAGRSNLDRRGTWAMVGPGASATFGFGNLLIGGSVCSFSDVIQDCPAEPGTCMACIPARASEQAAPRDNHAGVRPTLYADGSAALVDAGIDLATWAATLSRHGGEASQ